MFRALSESGEFVCHGFYASLNGRTFALVPNYGDVATDDAGNALGGTPVKVSARHGFRAYEAPSPVRAYEVDAALDPTALSSVCVVGDPEDGRLVAFAHWYVTSSSAYQIRFVQPSDPRLNGLPVTNRKTGKVVGMYLTHSWFDAPGSCVPIDLLVFGDVPGDQRAGDVEMEREGWLGGEVATKGPPPARGFALGDYVFCETPDGRAKWVANVKPRLVVREDDPVLLRDSFAAVMDSLQRGVTGSLVWSTGAELALTQPLEMFLFGRSPPPPTSSTPAPPPPPPVSVEAAAGEEEQPTWL